MDTIFIQVASYRDQEMYPTIKDCIEKATYPERLRFGVCWQHAPEDDWDSLHEYLTDPRFTVQDVHWTESKGLGWARHRTQLMWKGETYTLQIDSHHRFIQGWDEELITMYKQTLENGSTKSIIGSYAAPYTPGEPLVNPGPYKMVGTAFSNYGTILFYPQPITDYQNWNKPIPARFVSGHFFFTIGEHCREYKYDPEIYFAGDEISLSIRSYTMGYDLYHPHKVVLWHEYIRSKSKKHWDDFDATSKNKGKVKDAWHELDLVSKKRLRQMLQEEDNDMDLGEYTLGSVRTHADFERYAGISFRHRKLHPATLRGDVPPVNLSPEEWLTGHQVYQLQLTLPPYPQGTDYIHISVEDKEGKILFETKLPQVNQPIYQVDFSCDSIPYKWTFWPHFPNEVWGEKKEIVLGKTKDAKQRENYNKNAAKAIVDQANQQEIREREQREQAQRLHMERAKKEQEQREKDQWVQSQLALHEQKMQAQAQQAVQQQEAQPQQTQQTVCTTCPSAAKAQVQQKVQPVEHYTPQFSSAPLPKRVILSTTNPFGKIK